MTSNRIMNFRAIALATRVRILSFFGCMPLAVVGIHADVAQAVQYDFLSVTGNNTPGNSASTTFTSDYGRGTVGVTHSFSLPAAVGALDNINSAIYPSRFEILFPATGFVQGHLAQTVYGDPGPGGSNIHTSQVIFDLTTYNGSLPDLVFGLWNTTDEVTLPAYKIELLNASNVIVPPTAFSLIGNQQNQSQVQGAHSMQLNTLTGDITAPTALSGTTHTDAMFFKGIPTGTKQIIVTANLPPLNNVGDGVGYYFAEVTPEPGSATLIAIGAMLAGVRRMRRR